MQIHLLAIGTKMPQWVEQGYLEYSRRLGRDCQLTLREIASPRRSKTEDSEVVCKREGELLLASVPNGAHVIALDEQGKQHSTKSLAARLEFFKESSRTVALLIGGADGLSEQVLTDCNERWSLSALTFPHALVRVIVAEQIYRADSLLKKHPYHRA